MLIRTQTTKGIDQLRTDLAAACKRHEFGVLGEHDLRAKLAEKGQSYEHACLVFDVCNPVQARRVLGTEPAISAALPCRISAFERADGRRELVTIRPTALVGLFDTPELREVAREVEETLRAIVAEAAGQPVSGEEEPMDRKKRYVEDVERALEELKVKASLAKLELRDVRDELSGDYDRLRGRLHELREASGERFDALREGFEASWSAFKRTYDAAMKKRR